MRPVTRYIACNAVEFALVVVCASCLAMTVGDCFNIAYETLFDIPLVAGSAAGIAAVCYVGAYRRRNLFFAIPACLALMGVVVWASSLSAQVGGFRTQSLVGVALLDDAEDGNLVYGFALACVPPLVFLATRRRVPCAFLFVVGIFVCGCVQFLYEEWLWGPFTGFLLSCAVLFVLRGNRTAAAAHALQAAFSAALVCSVLLALSFLVWFACIAPFGPAALQLKLVQQEYLPEIHYLTSHEQERPTRVEPGEFSDTVDDGYTLYTSNEHGTGTDAHFVEDSDKVKRDGGSGGLSYALAGLAGDLVPVVYEMPDWLLWIIAALAVAALLVAIAARRWLRARWYSGLARHDARYRVCALYDALTRSLERMKLVKPPAMTQVEYARSAAPGMVAFAQGTDGADYLRLSRIYERVYYGHEQPSEEDLGAYERFWRVFHRNARRYSGPLRWLWRFWRV